MNTEDYIIVNKKELETELISLKSIRDNNYKLDGWQSDRDYVDIKIYCIEKIISNSNPLTPLLEETFEASREFNSIDGVVDVHIVLNMPQHDLSDLSPLYYTLEDFIKDKEL